MQDFYIEVTAILLLGLGLAPVITLITLSRVDLEYLRAIPTDEAIESITDAAEEVLVEEIDTKLNRLCEMVELPIPPDLNLIDLFFNIADDFDQIHACYQNLMAHGLLSSTFMDVLAQVQRL